MYPKLRKMAPVNFWEVFEATATRFAERTAIEIQGPSATPRESWSYRQLRQRSLQQAAFLAARGLGAGDRCAILGDNDATWCSAYLGVLRLGAIAVPLDTNYSAEQVATIVSDSGARILVSGKRLDAIARQTLGTLPEIIVLDLAATPDAAATDLPPCEIRDGDPAVILYTSGTTADPKGVVLTHANLIAERDATFAVVSVSETDSVLGVLPLFHALAQLANLLLPFAVGARVVFLETLSATELLRALAERQITIFACVPQFFYLIHQRITEQVRKAGLPGRLLFQAALAIGFGLRRLGVNAGPLLFRQLHAMLGTHMRLFITGGSKFDPAIGRDFYALGFTIRQAYGLTETSGAATLAGEHDAFLDTVGRPLPGQEIRILDAESEELDGEIAIRGGIVMHGYFNRPDATAAVMRDGWLLTGDLGRIDAQGRLSITGRKKEVIVLASGKNIYPEEIEAQYRKSAFIKEICVLGLRRSDDPISERLYAVVVPDNDLLREKRIVNVGDLLRFEIEGQSVHLPPHKRVLGYEIWFEALPRTTTGKLKRHEIERRIKSARPQPASRDAATAVADHWVDDPHVAEALKIVAARTPHQSVITPDASLELDLGLDSMERVELVTNLEQHFGVQLAADRAHEILSVRQLVDAVRPTRARVANATVDQSWDLLLRDLPPITDPLLSGLLERRPIATRMFFAAAHLLRALLPRIEASGLEHLPATGPYILSPNHQGYLDPFLVCGVLPFRIFKQLFFVGAAEYFETPFMRWLARQCNCVPVDPDANLVPAMRAGAFGLARGKILMLFPEGERSIDGTVKRFKKGAPILSRHLHVPIVPVAIRGAYELWPRNRRFNWKVIGPWSGHRVRIRFGAPLQFDASLSYADAAVKLRESVARLWHEI